MPSNRRNYPSIVKNNAHQICAIWIQMFQIIVEEGNIPFHTPKHDS
jgi:hypothetical protein